MSSSRSPGKSHSKDDHHLLSAKTQDKVFLRNSAGDRPKSPASPDKLPLSPPPARADPANAGKIILREPARRDGYPVNQLVALCPPLDKNSTYCNLLQCTDFSSTGVVAELDGRLVAFTSGYIPPAQPDALFIWQVAVHSDYRDQGLGKKMIRHLLERKSCASVQYLRTTITKSNRPSWGLFQSLAKTLNSEILSQVYFDSERHFGGEHESEYMVVVGPLKR
ncbi:L-2,4-diaminobutyric acid acetyltransferase [Planoprotostelium fungivorum]|uniref:L-2,4-diaminobutyric acid acetyltransferase n=1 Tax=Planoprotostelium fungivorum TaxID=1890364 RepID=A0A2P6NPQ7_9EUKA|nr:L-2,4-diaminobutyric acid acetyltransferase [Planoprotostelium fungivorum]